MIIFLKNSALTSQFISISILVKRFYYQVFPIPFGDILNNFIFPIIQPSFFFSISLKNFFPIQKHNKKLLVSSYPRLLYADYPQFLEKNEDILSEERINLLAEKTEVKVLFSIRKDRLADLDRLRKQLPAILHKRYELGPLDRKHASDSILKPAQEKGDYLSPVFTYEASALETLLNELSGGENLGTIEAFQLQVVCSTIEQKVIKENITEIGVGELPDFKTVYENYYAGRLAEAFSPEEEKTVRNVLEQGLLLVDGQGEARRLSRDAEELATSFEIAPDLLQRLERTYLIRREVNSLGGFNYELSHDTLIAPVLKARQEKERIEAEIRAREAEEKAAEEQRKTEEANRLKEAAIKGQKRARNLAIVAIIAFLAAVGVGIFALNERDKAETARNEANRQLEQALIEKQQRLELEKEAWIRKQTSYQKADYQPLILKAGRMIDSLNQRISENEAAIQNLKEP